MEGKTWRKGLRREWKMIIISFLGRVALVAQGSIVIKLSRGRSVDLCFGASVCPVHCDKTADRIWVPFSIVGRTGPGMRQVVGFGDRSTGMGTFWGEFRARHGKQWGLYGVRVRQCRDAALFPNYFGQTCCFNIHACGFMLAGSRNYNNSICIAP